MRVAVIIHALPIYKKNRIASLLCIFETTIFLLFVINAISCLLVKTGVIIVCPYIGYEISEDPDEILISVTFDKGL